MMKWVGVSGKQNGALKRVPLFGMNIDGKMSVEEDRKQE
jgi:hypothetical protein